MKSWTQCFLERHREDGPSVTIMDRLGCYWNREVLAQLQQREMEPFLLSPQAAKLISPCDNSFFASLKARLRTINTSTVEDKRAAFLDVCEEDNPGMVKHCFAHCKWASKPSQNQIERYKSHQRRMGMGITGQTGVCLRRGVHL
jgi:hypothetical protein